MNRMDMNRSLRMDKGKALGGRKEGKESLTCVGEQSVT